MKQLQFQQKSTATENNPQAWLTLALESRAHLVQLTSQLLSLYCIKVGVLWEENIQMDEAEVGTCA